MKKISLIIASLLICLTSMSQDMMNRIIVNSGWNFDAYMVERVDSITFGNIEGTVAAELELLDATLEMLTVKITRSTSCQAFKLTVIPAVMADIMTDADMVDYIDQYEPNLFWQDFEKGELTGIELVDNAEYVIATLGFDSYGVPCEVRRVEFKTPAVEVIGSPEVKIEIIEVKEREFTVKFTPNEDVEGYSIMCYEKGRMMENYQQWAAMDGWAKPEQMLESWGILYYTEDTYTWTGMTPGTEYEIYAQSWDENHTYAPWNMAELTSKAFGGEGEANVTITLGEYKMTDWWGEMLPSQFITFTPNDQTNFYKVNVYSKEVYDKNTEEINTEMQTIMSSWDMQFEELTTDFNIDPNTTCVALACAQNAVGEWGPIAKVEFTTPNEPLPAGTPRANVIKQRPIKNKPVSKLGVVPNRIKKSTGVQLNGF